MKKLCTTLTVVPEGELPPEQPEEEFQLGTFAMLGAIALLAMTTTGESRRAKKALEVPIYKAEKPPKVETKIKEFDTTIPSEKKRR